MGTSPVLFWLGMPRNVFTQAQTRVVRGAKTQGGILKTWLCSVGVRELDLCPRLPEANDGWTLSWAFPYQARPFAFTELLEFAILLMFCHLVSGGNGPKQQISVLIHMSLFAEGR